MSLNLTAWELVMHSLPRADLERVKGTCRTLRKLANSESVWAGRFIRMFSALPPNSHVALDDLKERVCASARPKIFAETGNGEISLLRAIRHGDVRQASRLILEEGKVWLPGPDGATALHLVVEKVLQLSNRSFGRGVLSIRPWKDLLKLCVQRGAFIDAADNSGITPLSLARNDLRVEQLLIGGRKIWDQGSSESCVRFLQFEQARFRAAAQSQLDIHQKWLLKTASSDLDVAGFLAAGGDVNFRYVDGTTLLYQALKTHRLRDVRALIANGAALNITCAQGESPLTVAIASGHKEIVPELIQAGADLQVALKHAIDHENGRAVDDLLGVGAQATPATLDHARGKKSTILMFTIVLKLTQAIKT